MSAADTPLLVLEGAGYRYPSSQAAAVEGVDLAIAPGERVLLTGPTGCGKSTLLRLAGGLLGRHGQGQVSGQVRVCGTSPDAIAPRERVATLGFVSQEPNDQLVAGTVGDELAFGMESAGWSAARIDARIPDLLRAAGLSLDLDRSPRTLSGGQTQRLVTAAALGAGGRVLLLDEPLAQLDPVGAQRLLAALRHIAADGVAVIMVEHRLEAALPWCSRCVVMDGGRRVGDHPGDAFQPGSQAVGTLRRLGLTLPGMLDLADRLGTSELRPLLARLADTSAPPTAAPTASPVRPVSALVAVGDLHHRWTSGGDLALAGVSLEVRAGDRVALLGGNGAGKSTLLTALAGGLSARSGEGRRTQQPDTRVVAVPQDPDLALFCATVREELAHGPTEQRLAAGEVAARVARVARGLSLDRLLDRAPQAASRGQRLRIAVGAALACRPDVLLLDEPTSGQDHDQVEAMFDALDGLLGDGALVFATHDVDLALRRAHRVVVLDAGRVVGEGPPCDVLPALPVSVPLALPPLASLCDSLGVTPGMAGELYARLRTAGLAPDPGSDT